MHESAHRTAVKNDGPAVADGAQGAMRRPHGEWLPATRRPAVEVKSVAYGKPQRKGACSACGGSSSSGSCSSCEEKKRTPDGLPRLLEEPLGKSQTKRLESPAAGGGDPAERQADEVGAQIGHALQGAGVAGPGALSGRIRSVAEEHLGVDLSGTVLRTDGRAAEHASGMDAVAVTEGSTVSFARSQLDTSSREGRALLGHELTHVAQQRASRHAASQRRGTPPPPPAPPPVLRPAPVRPTTGTIPGSTPAPDAVVGGPRYVPSPGDNSLDAMFQRQALQDTRERQIAEAQRPSATLDRGGASAGGFITDAGRGSSVDEFGQFSYRLRRFHVLDAISWRVSGAQTTRDLLRILWEFNPELVPALDPANRPAAPIILPLFGPDAPKFPNGMDPGGLIRLQVFMQAVKARGIALADPRVKPIPLEQVTKLMSPVPEETQGACDVAHVPRRGGHPPHDAYATAITGSTRDFLVRTPEGVDCQTDGIDRSGVTWEVKTGHALLTESRLASVSPHLLHQVASRIEEQRVRCLFATSRCGYPYVYAFADPEVVRWFNDMWGGRPRAVCRSEQGKPC